jgi:hypothetical protein
MKRSVHRRTRSTTWLYALLLITGVSSLLFGVTFILDTAGIADASLGAILFQKSPISALDNMPEVVTGVLGITITVVAIIVELSANRYTPRVTDLFVKAPVNLLALGFFVVTAVLCVWFSFTESTALYVPRVGRIVVIFAISLSLLALLPYFVFVFTFLDPHSIVARMGTSALKAIKEGRDTGTVRAKQLSVIGIEQLTDVALNAIEHKDKGISMHAVDTLGQLIHDYLEIKSEMPTAWFTLDEEVAENPDFISMQKSVLKEIETRQYWLEMKVLRQYQMLYGETLNRMRDINYLIAINTRKLAEVSIRNNTPHTTVLALKFMNTYLRATINGRDVRTAYNVLNQYRLLAESALHLGAYDLVLDIAKWFKYYGQLGFTTGIPFVLETTAYDLCALNELAFELNAPCRKALLDVFLDVDKEAEVGHALEASLRGVRKAQIKLAAYYLARGEQASARVIFEDMRNEVTSRLTSIRQELEGIETPDFWEISDRGGNFDYMAPEEKATLVTFFGWFGARR